MALYRPSETAVSAKARELLRERMATVTLDDAVAALSELTYDASRFAAFNDLLQSGHACDVGHAVLRAVESLMEAGIRRDAEHWADEQEAAERAKFDGNSHVARVFLPVFDNLIERSR